MTDAIAASAVPDRPSTSAVGAELIPPIPREELHLGRVRTELRVTGYDPFQIIQCALTRQNPALGRDSPVQTPQHRIGIEDAIKGYTINAAHAAWRDDCTGSLAPGKYADLILLDRDLYAISPYEIGRTRVLLTLLEGREVHRDPTFAS